MADTALLARVLADFARTVIRRYDVGEVVEQFCEHVATILPNAGAGVSLADAGGVLRFIGASDELVVRVEDLQVALQEGACRTAYDTGAVVVCRDLRADARWPRYARGAVAEGIVGVLGYPMAVDGRIIGALNVYSTSPLDLSDEDLETTGVLAAVGASFVINARERRESRELTRQLQAALESRVLIEQAKGALAERLGVPVDEAFGLLRRHARSNGLPLRQVCRDVVERRLSLGGARRSRRVPSSP